MAIYVNSRCFLPTWHLIIICVCKPIFFLMLYTIMWCGVAPWFLPLSSIHFTSSLITLSIQRRWLMLSVCSYNSYNKSTFAAAISLHTLSIYSQTNCDPGKLKVIWFHCDETRSLMVFIDAIYKTCPVVLLLLLNHYIFHSVKEYSLLYCFGSV